MPYLSTFSNTLKTASSLTTSSTLSGTSDGYTDYLLGSASGDDIRATVMSAYMKGGLGNDSLFGNVEDDKLFGDEGNDYLEGGKGNDELYGGSGMDCLYGGLGRDLLEGGSGWDLFVFKSKDDSGIDANTRDTILDFERGDRIDLSGIDAHSGNIGNQAFTLTTGFSGKGGELIIQKTASGFLINADINGDGQADFSLSVKSAVTSLSAADFLL